MRRDNRYGPRPAWEAMFAGNWECISSGYDENGRAAPIGPDVKWYYEVRNLETGVTFFVGRKTAIRYARIDPDRLGWRHD